MRALLKRILAARRVILIYAALLVGGWMLSEGISEISIPEMRPMNEPLIHRFVMIVFVVFVFAAALPFVPGAEIGFALLLFFGAKAALLVYSGMVLALGLAYVTARVLPARWVLRAMSWLKLKRASQFVSELELSSPEERKTMWSRAIPNSLGDRFVRNRYLMLAIALNTPGNSLLGGGGGLAFLAGKSGIFPFWPFMATIALAVAPFPLSFWFFGIHPLR